jgi:uncharacterized protein
LTRNRLREPLPDALRALALAGVLVVNGLGYRDVPYGRLLGEAQPAGSLLAHAVTFCVAALVQGKAYPVLAFLFGMGLAYAARGRGAASAIDNADRRSRRLLLLGLVHGVLLYYGDILTLYALCAFWVARQMREPWCRFAARLRSALGWAVMAVLASTALAFVPLGGPVPHGSIGTVAGHAEFVRLNASTYVAAQLFGLVLALPLVRLGMLTGVAAARLRLLTHRRWRALGCATLRRWLAPLLAANLAYAAAYLVVRSDQRALSLALETASPLWASPLAALYVMAASLVWHGERKAWLAWLAPLGQHTLSVYVGASLVMLFVLSGAGLAWRPSTIAWATAALGVWLLAAAASMALPGRWPLEAWMARR